MQPLHFENAQDITVLGPACRTSPQQAAQDIPALWQRFLGDGWVSGLPRQGKDSSIYAVYCDYESDWRGPYTMVLGVASFAAAPIPEGLRTVRIPAGRYARFSLHGKPSQVLWKTWSYIGQQWPEGGSRRYVADFERYSPEAVAAMAQGEIDLDIVVGLT